MGTWLGQRGVRLDPPLWSAHALIECPEQVFEAHQAYAEAGADIHTANSFRCQPGRHPDWQSLLQKSVDLAREAAQLGSRVAGSMAPIEDCYRPDLSPKDCRRGHTTMANALANAGVDLILCETFPNPVEALVAVNAGVQTGKETWLMLTAGPDASLLAPEALLLCAQKALDAGASIVGINCTAVTKLSPFVDALTSSKLPVAFSANAGEDSEGMGWNTPSEEAASRYAAEAQKWVAAGAQVIGSCCGTGPAHTKALRALIDGH